MVKKVVNPDNARCRETDRKFCRGLHSLLHRKNNGGGTAVKISDLSRASKTVRSTFYRHYDGINEMMLQIEDWIIEDFKRTIIPMAKSNIAQHMLFFRLLIFIREHKDYFQIIFDLESYRLLNRMFKELHPIITKNWINYGNSNQVYQIYFHEMSAAIMLWYKDGRFSKNTIDDYVNQMVYLTKYANNHLKGLPKEKEK